MRCLSHLAAFAADDPKSPKSAEKAEDAVEKTAPAAAEKIDPAPAEKNAPAQLEKTIGRAIRMQLPIDGQTLPRVKRFVNRSFEQARAENATPVLIFEFYVPKGQENFGRGSDFFNASSVADYLTSAELNGARTVAYIPQSIQGHAVLAAIACQQIIMDKDATIGAAGIDEKTILPEYAGWYKTIANRRRTVPEGIALAMLNPADELYLVDTEEAQGDLRRSRRLGGTEEHASGGHAESRQARGRNGAIHRERSAADDAS